MLDGKSTDTYTGRHNLGTGPISMETNASPAQYAREVEMIFRKTWHLVGRAEEIPATGAYFVQDIPTLETSILVVRGRDNEIRAFHNMCRHRGNKVVHTGHTRGKAKGFSCAFHGWTYDLTGKLVIVPDEDQFFDFDKKDHGLTPVACDVWEGFIFIHPQNPPPQPLADWLGEMGGQFGGYFKDLHLYAHFAADVGVNWKIFLDAFAEGYHAPFIHGKTLPEAFTGEKNPLLHMQSARIYDIHRAISLPANPEYVPTPIERVIGKFVKGAVFPAVKSDMENLPPGVNPERNPYWGVDLNIIFPVSYFGAWANNSLLIYHFWPTAVDRTRWEVKLYWDAPATAAERINLELTREMTIAIVREDLSSLETTQEAVNSGATDIIHLSEQEVLCRHNYKVVEAFTGGA